MATNYAEFKAELLKQEGVGGEAAKETNEHQSLSAQIAAIVAGHMSTYAATIKPEKYGAVGDGTTDDGPAVNLALAAAYAAAGGVVELTAGKTYRCATALVIPNDGGGTPKQRPLTILSFAGPRWDGSWATSVTGGAVLDLQAAGGIAKIDTRGLGYLRLRGLTLTQTSNASDTVPFIRTSNTTLDIQECAFIGHPSLSGSGSLQDAIVLGGTSTSYDGTSNGAFQGYGTTISGNYFGRIRRAVYGQTYANAVKVTNNTVASTSGGNSTTGAICIDGSVGFANGNTISDNLIEMANYAVGIRLKNSSRNYCSGNSFWDDGGTLVACYYLEGATTQNNWLGGIFTSGTQTSKRVVLDATAAGSQYTMVSNNEFYPARLSGATTLLQPELATGSESNVILAVKRSGNEGTNPNVFVASLTQAAGLAVGGSWASTANVSVTSGTPKVTMDSTSIVKNSGHLDLYAGSTATDMTRIQRGLFQLPRHTTAGRPAASVGAGACYYDTTVSKPVFSDGTTWRDAAGTAV